MSKLVFLLFLLMMPMLPLFCVDNYDEESFVIEAIIPGQTTGQPYSNLVVVDLTGSSESHTVIQNNDQFYIGRGEQLQTGTGMDLFEIHYVTNDPSGATITVTLGDFTKAEWNGNSYVAEESTSPTTLESDVGFGALSWIGSGSNDLWLESDLTDIPNHFSDNESGKRYQYPSKGYSLTVAEDVDAEDVDGWVYSLTFSAQYFTLKWTDVDGGYDKNLNLPAAAEDYPLNIEFVKRFSVSIDSGAVVDPGFYRMDVKIEVGSNL